MLSVHLFLVHLFLVIWYQSFLYYSSEYNVNGTKLEKQPNNIRANLVPSEALSVHGFVEVYIQIKSAMAIILLIVCMSAFKRQRKVITQNN